MAKKKRITPVRFMQDILDEITPERQAELDRNMELHRKWMDEHPGYNERYGTDRSYWLQEIRDKGFDPVGITTMLCEETIIMRTVEEIEAAWEIFKPEGWWYTVDQWEARWAEYTAKFYTKYDKEPPKVYCLAPEFQHILK